MGASKWDGLPNEVEFAVEATRRNRLHGFFQHLWPVFEPSAEFSDNWHIGQICEALEAVSSRQIRQLVINVPPGCTKSSLVSVAWPAWHWINDPGHRWMNISNDPGLVHRDADKLIQILQSKLYRTAWPYAARLEKNNPATGNFWTSAKGQRFSTSTHGKAIGQHAHTQVWDDPSKPTDILTGGVEALDKVFAAFNGTFATRMADPKTFAKVIIMQRLHEVDLAGRCLARGGWDHLMLPMRYVPMCQWDIGNSLGMVDPRTNANELLWPERYDEEAVDKLEIELGNDASAQLQQNPTPGEGGFIEENWCRLEWLELPRKVAFYQSWDFSSGGKNLKANSAVHGALWAVGKVRHARRLLTPLALAAKGGVELEYEEVDFGEERLVHMFVDEIRGWWNYPEAKDAFEQAQELDQWDRAVDRIVEKKANGIALIDELGKAYHIVEVNPTDSKELRLAVQSKKFRDDYVLWPRPDRLAVTFDVRQEHVKFPHGAQDDRVDTTTQLLAHVDDDLELLRRALKREKNNLRLGR